MSNFDLEAELAAFYDKFPINRAPTLVLPVVASAPIAAKVGRKVIEIQLSSSSESSASELGVGK